MGLEYIELSIKNLISSSGIKLIDLYFKENPEIDVHYVRLGQLGLYYNKEIVNVKMIIDILKDELGFEIIDNKELQLLEKIKIAAIEQNKITHIRIDKLFI